MLTQTTRRIRPALVGALMALFGLFSCVPVLADVQSLKAGGTLTATGQCVVLPGLSGQAEASTTLSGTWVGTVTFSQIAGLGASENNSLTATLGGLPAATATTNGIYHSPLGAATQFSACFTRTSGSVIVSITAGGGEHAQTAISVSGGSTAQGAPNSVANGWPVRSCDIVTGFCLGLNSSGQVGISNFPSNQAITTDGTVATGVTQDSGGAGAIGWLSSITKNLRLITTAVQGTLTVTLAAGSQTIGSIANTTFAVTQATGSNLHAVLDASSAVIGHVIVDSGNIVLSAGSAIVGKVTTDQTTPGTTDLVHAKVCDTTTSTQCAAVSAGGVVSVSTPPPFNGVVSGTVTANQGGTWTVQPGNTPNTAPWLTTIQQGGIPASVYNYGGGDFTSANALAVASQGLILGAGACSGSPAICPGERVRSASFGNNIAATGLQAAAIYCQYNSSLPTVSTGNYSAAQCNASGQLYVVNTRVATTNTTIAVNSGTTTIVTGAGRLHGVLTTTTGATAFTCYDNTAASGTLVFDQALASLGFVTLPSGGVPFSTGLTCVSGATGPAVTVSTGPA